MKKYPRRSVIFDKLHRGGVMICIGVTVFALAHLGYKWYSYFGVTKPEHQKLQLIEKQELLAEGSSERLQDLAPNLSV